MQTYYHKSEAMQFKHNPTCYKEIFNILISIPTVEAVELCCLSHLPYFKITTLIEGRCRPLRLFMDDWLVLENNRISVIKSNEFTINVL